MIKNPSLERLNLEREDFINYARWLIEFWCFDHNDLLRIAKFMESISEEKHEQN